ncbi:MAG: alpha-amylase family glycosyl hydrolase [Prolixibacteraceae bacterium]
MNIRRKLNMNLNRKDLFKMNTIILLLSLLFITPACNNDDPIVINPPVNNEKEEQFGVPFNGVPEIADIVMYEVNIKAFSNEGTLAGVSKRLDSIQALGVNVVWLMPIYPIGDLKGVGSPYAVRDYMGVNPDFGSLADLRILVEKAHQLGMAVILDWVANHTSWDNEWVSNDDWYTKDVNGDLVSPNGWTDVIDLNYNSTEMRQAMMDAMNYWVYEANIDGYRCDHVDGVPIDFWKEAIDNLDTIPDHQLIFFAEGTKAEYYQAGFDLNFGWNVYGSLKGVIAENKPATNVYAANASDYAVIPAGKHMLHFITNHDDNAWDDTPDKIFKTQDGAMAVFVISAYMSGVPMLYCGQEIGYPYKLSFFTKTPINWSLNPSITAEYKKILSFRAENEALRKGSLKTYNNADAVVFKRIGENGDEVLVLVNVRNKEVKYSIPSELANSKWSNQLTKEEVQLGSEIQLDAFQYLILK